MRTHEGDQPGDIKIETKVKASIYVVMLAMNMSETMVSFNLKV